MTTKLAALIAMVLVFGAPGFAHRLDEYLQATLISIEKDRIDWSVRLIPGIAVSSAVLTSIDTNGDGVISETERRAYAERVLRDLSLSVDGRRLKSRLTSVTFPPIEEIKEGLGQIQILFSADLPSGSSNRKLIFENHHQAAISVYLMNSLIPRDHDIRILDQTRNHNQSLYQVDYTQAGGASDPTSPNVGFASIFRLGVRHIAEGNDHLLFLLALLLPAPLTVSRSRWSIPAPVSCSLGRILKVVTAFTVGHSITLALAGLDLVRAPGRPIELLIAFSILVSAAHALRPIFPGREAMISAFFGLIHGLALASTIAELGLNRWDRVMSILAFNLGIEAMQLIVVAASMPSLLLLSRTRVYSTLRIGAALFAGLAAIGWMFDRLFGVQSPVDSIVDRVAHEAVWIALALFSISVICCVVTWQRGDVAARRRPVLRRWFVEIDPL